MDHRWLQFEETEEAREALRKRVRSCSDVLEVLDKILKGQLDTKEIAREPDYLCPSWAYKQADTNGYIRALTTIRKLLDVEEK